MKALAYIDGGGNKGYNSSVSSCVVYIGDPPTRKIKASRFFGDHTNNVAEYGGVILALEIALREGVTELEIRSDSQLIVNQLMGTYKCKKDHLRTLRDRAWRLASELDRVEVNWVRREQNKESDGHGRRLMGLRGLTPGRTYLEEAEDC